MEFGAIEVREIEWFVVLGGNVGSISRQLQYTPWAPETLSVSGRLYRPTAGLRIRYDDPGKIRPRPSRIAGDAEGAGVDAALNPRHAPSNSGSAFPNGWGLGVRVLTAGPGISTPLR